jgi:hypothetical protein
MFIGTVTKAARSQTHLIPAGIKTHAFVKTEVKKILKPLTPTANNPTSHNTTKMPHHARKTQEWITLY